MAFNLRIVHQAIEVFESYVQKKQKEIRDTMVFLQGQDDLNFRQHDVLRKAVANPDSKFTIKSYKTTYNVVYETARADLEKLVKKGFVIKKRIGREFYYFPSSDINDKLRKVIPVDTGNAGN
jgi:Fic family protein